MTASGRQLVLEIAPSPAFGLDDFFLSPANEAAFAHIRRWPDWSDPVSLLVGPQGSGKSHLAAIWARQAGAVPIMPGDVGGAPDAPLLVEDAERMGDEAGLFHLINMVGERRSTLLLTTSRAPEQWPVRLPDLLSRLRRAARVTIDHPDETLVRAVLVKLLVDRQLLIDVGVVESIVRRVDRSLDAVRDLVQRLDHEALASGRRITRGLVSDLLRDCGRHDNEEDEAP